MGISDFRRQVQRWLNAVLFSAQQDAESDSASRRPIDADPVGAIDGRVVDAVEEALAETRSGSRAIKAAFDIQHQAPLTESELSAMYGIGHRLLRGGIDGPQPLAHIRRPRAHQQAGTSDHASRIGTSSSSTLTTHLPRRIGNNWSLMAKQSLLYWRR